VISGKYQAVAKFIPKTPCADREVLFVRLDGVRNVVPVIDSGEQEDNCVIVMPRADVSLPDYLDTSGTPPTEQAS
jgi:eukaryotic-like serine/threonine-protein kinase